MKMVKDVLGKTKGEDKINDVLTGKSSFSSTGFTDLVTAMVNDTSFKIPTYGKDGKKDGEVSISELIRDDLKKTLDKAKYPQKSESAVVDNCEIAANGLAKAIPYIVMQQIASGKKFDLPAMPKVQGSVYLQNVPGRVKESQIRDPKTQQNLGSVTTTTKDHIEIRTKSSCPDYLATKVRKDPNGKIVK